ncbi:hypothetical protein V8C42DRAFT_38894 [Trichoderma barbatum]
MWIYLVESLHLVMVISLATAVLCILLDLPDTVRSGLDNIRHPRPPIPPISVAACVPFGVVVYPPLCMYTSARVIVAPKLNLTRFLSVDVLRFERPVSMECQICSSIIGEKSRALLRGIGPPTCPSLAALSRRIRSDIV